MSLKSILRTVLYTPLTVKNKAVFLKSKWGELSRRRVYNNQLYITEGASTGKGKMLVYLSFRYRLLARCSVSHSDWLATNLAMRLAIAGYEAERVQPR